LRKGWEVDKLLPDKGCSRDRRGDLPSTLQDPKEEMVEVTPNTNKEVSFYFDPACPWTWLTSRWLLEAASVRSISIKWAPLSLLLLNGGEVPESFRERLTQSTKALRAIASLSRQGRHEEIANFYTTIGSLYHYNEEIPSDRQLSDALLSAGAGSETSALHDESLDELVRHFHDQAVALSGPSTGTPVLELSPNVGIFGPILTAPIVGEEAGELFDHVHGLACHPRFSELKRGRTGPPLLL
jgi:hypothetical protein